MLRLGIFLLLVTSVPLQAATTTPNLDLATTFGSLLFVIVIILCFAWLLKRMRIPTMVNQKGLSVVKQIPVGTRERIMVVKAGDEQFLVGVTSQSINLISKLDKPLPEDAPLATPFASQLANFMKKNEK